MGSNLVVIKSVIIIKEQYLWYSVNPYGAVLSRDSTDHVSLDGK